MYIDNNCNIAFCVIFEISMEICELMRAGYLYNFYNSCLPHSIILWTNQYDLISRVYSQGQVECDHLCRKPSSKPQLPSLANLVPLGGRQRWPTARVYRVGRPHPPSDPAPDRYWGGPVGLVEGGDARAGGWQQVQEQTLTPADGRYHSHPTPTSPHLVFLVPFKVRASTLSVIFHSYHLSSCNLSTSTSAQHISIHYINCTWSPCPQNVLLCPISLHTSHSFLL